VQIKETAMPIPTFEPLQTATLAGRFVARPDLSVAPKAAHEASQESADYDRWFDAKVQASINGLKDGTNRILSQHEVDERRAAVRTRLEAMRLVQPA